MAELIEIKRVLIGPENMTASVRLADDAPINTSEDLEGTTYVYRLMPHIVEHPVEEERGGIFREVMGNTDLADLLAHVTIELLQQTGLVDELPTMRTWADGTKRRAYKIELACPDDVLVVTALSCGAWILDWAYRGAGDPDPDIEAIVAGLVQLVENVGDAGEDMVVDHDAPKPPEEASDTEEQADDAAAELDMDEFDVEDDADHTSQIDFSKQYVFGKQGSPEGQADAGDSSAADEAAHDESADEEAAQAAEDREAALEAEIDMILSSSFMPAPAPIVPEEAEAMDDDEGSTTELHIDVRDSEDARAGAEEESTEMESAIDSIMASFGASADELDEAGEEEGYPPAEE